MMCRWRGFTKELDSLQRADMLAKDCPDKVREYFKQAQDSNAVVDPVLSQFMDEAFPSLRHEEAVERQRRQPGTIARGRKRQLRRRG